MGGMEAVITGLSDDFKILKRNRKLFTFATAFGTFLIALLCITNVSIPPPLSQVCYSVIYFFTPFVRNHRTQDKTIEMANFSKRDDSQRSLLYISICWWLQKESIRPASNPITHDVVILCGWTMPDIPAPFSAFGESIGSKRERYSWEK